MYTTYRDYNLYSGLPTTEIIEPIKSIEFFVKTVELVINDIKE